MIVDPLELMVCRGDQSGQVEGRSKTMEKAHAHMTSEADRWTRRSD
jgi:hypothetical protein